MKKLICLALAFVLAALCVGCFGPSQEELLAKVEGTWSTRYQADAEFVESLLTSFDFSTEESALVSTPLYCARALTLNSDYTYSYARPVDGMKTCVREFWVSAYDELYEGRATLESVYDADLSAMSKDAFLQFYADLYEQENFEALLNLFVENSYNYEGLGIYETGTFTITSLQITVDTEGTADDGYINYKVEGDTLTLTYTDGTEVYTKEK